MKPRQFNVRTNCTTWPTNWGRGNTLQILFRAGLKITRTKTIGKTKTICKVRGITLNYITSQIVNFETIRDMILNGEEHIVVVHSDKKIKRKRTFGGPSVVSEPEDKRYTITFFKRRRLHNNDSLPFGFVG